MLNCNFKHKTETEMQLRDEMNWNLSLFMNQKNILPY